VIAIIVAYDSAEVLPACLEALRGERVPAIVVDNASEDASAAIAEAAGMRVIRNPSNEGYGRAMNIGLKAATGHDCCLLLNPDLVLASGATAALKAAALAYPDAAMLAPRLVEPDGRFFFQSRSLLSPYLKNEGGAPCLPEGDCCAPFLSGACLLVERDFILSLGGFDEKIFLFCEDNDLCRRVIAGGRSLVHVHDAIAHHRRGGSTAPKPGRAYKARWHMAWSAGYTTRKYGLPDPSWRSLMVNAAKFALAALTFNRRLMERYGGSAAGALASLRRKSALEREGLG
jgi:GT2 family glycosyltransferase